MSMLKNMKVHGHIYISIYLFMTLCNNCQRENRTSLGIFRIVLYFIPSIYYLLYRVNLQVPSVFLSLMDIEKTKMRLDEIFD